MNRTIHAVIAVFALAALLTSAAGICLCTMPPAAAGAHDCCAGDGGAILAAAHECCVSRAPASAPVLVVAVPGALPPQAAVLSSPWLDAAATPLASPLAGPPPSAAPSILRI